VYRVEFWEQLICRRCNFYKHRGAGQCEIGLRRIGLREIGLRERNCLMLSRNGTRGSGGPL
jgi:hypothetical protein